MFPRKRPSQKYLISGEYGRLGHGDNVTQLRPKQVKSLIGQRVVQVRLFDKKFGRFIIKEIPFYYSNGLDFLLVQVRVFRNTFVRFE